MGSDQDAGATAPQPKTPDEEIAAKVEQWIRERNPEAEIIRAQAPLDKRRIDVFLHVIVGVGRVWIEAGRDSRIDKDFITWELDS